VTDSDAFHDLKYSMAELFREVADCLSGQAIPELSRVQELDRPLRDLEKTAPPWLRFGEWEGVGGEGMTVPQRRMVALLKDKALLGECVRETGDARIILRNTDAQQHPHPPAALHRPMFAQALACQPEPLVSPHSASFTACISASRRHIQVMRSILHSCPSAPYHWWFFLFQAFTGAVIQAAVLLRCPRTILANEREGVFPGRFQGF
jgi:hypothetical protein